MTTSDLRGRDMAPAVARVWPRITKIMERDSHEHQHRFYSHGLPDERNHAPWDISFVSYPRLLTIFVLQVIVQLGDAIHSFIHSFSFIHFFIHLRHYSPEEGHANAHGGGDPQIPGAAVHRQPCERCHLSKVVHMPAELP